MLVIVLSILLILILFMGLYFDALGFKFKYEELKVLYLIEKDANKLLLKQIRQLLSKDEEHE